MSIKPELDKARVLRGAQRVLEVFAKRERRRFGLMQQHFHDAFSSDGWTMHDFRLATHHAYEVGWIDLDANFYCLTQRGAQQLHSWWVPYAVSDGLLITGQNPASSAPAA